MSPGTNGSNGTNGHHPAQRSGTAPRPSSEQKRLKRVVPAKELAALGPTSIPHRSVWRRWSTYGGLGLALGLFIALVVMLGALGDKDGQIAQLEAELRSMKEDSEQALAELQAEAEQDPIVPWLDDGAATGQELSSEQLQARAEELERREQELADLEAELNALEYELAEVSFGPGAHTVGRDIEVGQYRVEPESSECNWASTDHAGLELDHLSGSRTDGAPVIVDIGPEVEVFESSGCGLWYRIG